MLGPLGQPVVAAVLAGGAAGRRRRSCSRCSARPTWSSRSWSCVVLAAIAAVALLWLRRIIHVGLLQESLEIAIGPDIACANCGKQTPSHTYCGECGVSLRALPKARGAPPSPPASVVVGRHGGARTRSAARRADADLPPGAAGGAVRGGRRPRRSATAATAPPRPRGHGWLGSQRLLIVFGVLLGAITVVSLVVAFVISQGLDQPECPGEIAPCGAAIVGAARGGRRRHATCRSRPARRLPRRHDRLLLRVRPGHLERQPSRTLGSCCSAAYGGALAYIVGGGPGRPARRGAAVRRPQDPAVASACWASTRTGSRPASSSARRHPGLPQGGIGGLFGGTIDSAQGPSTDFKTAIVAATDGTIVAVTTMIVPAEVPEGRAGHGRPINSSFTWPSDPVVQ